MKKKISLILIIIILSMFVSANSTNYDRLESVKTDEGTNIIKEDNQTTIIDTVEYKLKEKQYNTNLTGTLNKHQQINLTYNPIKFLDNLSIKDLENKITTKDLKTSNYILYIILSFKISFWIIVFIEFYLKKKERENKKAKYFIYLIHEGVSEKEAYNMSRKLK